VLDSADLEELGPNGSLSRREREVLEMTALGLTNGQIAGRLGVTVHAVKFHLASIYRKLGVANRTEAAVVYLRGERGDSRAFPDPGAR
jgi:DNA-binding CsgD family transcriptional regulator